MMHFYDDFIILFMLLWLFRAWFQQATAGKSVEAFPLNVKACSRGVAVSPWRKTQSKLSDYFIQT